MNTFLQSFILILSVAYVCGQTGKFLVISDIHFDPYFDPEVGTKDFCRDNPPKDFIIPLEPSKKGNGNISLPLNVLSDDEKHHIYGKYGCDSPYPLLESVLQAMQSEEGTPDFILVLGDTSAHYMDTWKDVVNAINNATETMASYFPGVPVLPILGNNDAFPDYQLPTGPTELVENIYSVWSDHGWLDASNGNTFSNGGYYAQVLFDDLKIIGLNTVSVFCFNPLTL
jgi:endopolyphosphatase